MKIKLSALNRLSLLGLLTNKGDSTTLKIVREMREELSFTPKEHETLQFKPLADGKVTWNEIPEVEYIYKGIHEIVVEKVKKELRKMEEKGELILDHLSLYEVLIEKVNSSNTEKENSDDELTLIDKK